MMKKMKNTQIEYKETVQRIKQAGLYHFRPLAPRELGSLEYIDLRNDPQSVKVGDRVYCTVSACYGWSTVVEVKGHGAGLRVKTDSFRGWGYGHNFTRKPPEYMTKG